MYPRAGRLRAFTPVIDLDEADNRQSTKPFENVLERPRHVFLTEGNRADRIRTIRRQLARSSEGHSRYESRERIVSKLLNSSRVVLEVL